MPAVQLVPYTKKKIKKRTGFMAGQAELPKDWKEWPEGCHEKLGLT